MFHAAVIPAAFSVVCRGGSLFVLDAFDPEQVVRVLEQERISVATLVPAMLQACLVAVGDVADRRYERLRSIYYGASPIAEDTLRQAIDAFGCGFVQSYGMTEAAQALTFLSAADHRRALDARPELLLSAGRAAVGDQASRRRRERCAACRPASRGEILRARPAADERLLAAPRRDRPDARATDGCTPATSGASTTTATCSSRTASRT